MKKKQLTLKLRVLEWILDFGKPFDANIVYNAIHEEYKGETFCNPKHIDRLIGAMCGNMLIEFDDTYQPNPGEENRIMYRVTDLGRKSEKFIPNRT